MTFNPDVLLRAADSIEQEEVILDMTDFVRIHGCGTSACIAGTIVLNDRPDLVHDEMARLAVSWSMDARDLLGIEGRSEELQDLFYCMGNQLSRGPDFDWLNKNRHLVPSMLRWMAVNNVLYWHAAAEALGYEYIPPGDADPG